jgi:hypothetical protein
MFVDVEADRMEAGMEGVLEVEQADRSTVKDSQGMLWMCWAGNFCYGEEENWAKEMTDVATGIL